MPPPGASAPAFAANVKPARARPMQKIQGKTRRQRVMERVLWDVLRDLLRERAEDGLLRASILDFKPKLANRCRVLPVYTIFRASILDFRPELGNRCSVIAAAVRTSPPATGVAATRFHVRFYSSLPQRRMVSPAASVAATSSASYSNLRCLEGDQKLNARPTPLLVAPSDRLGVLPFLSGFTYVLL